MSDEVSDRPEKEAEAGLKPLADFLERLRGPGRVWSVEIFRTEFFGALQECESRKPQRTLIPKLRCGNPLAWRWEDEDYTYRNCQSNNFGQRVRAWVDAFFWLIRDIAVEVSGKESDCVFKAWLKEWATNIQLGYEALLAESDARLAELEAVILRECQGVKGAN
jgi:hypothetical protein